jgi:hypothetical protein
MEGKGSVSVGPFWKTAKITFVQDKPLRRTIFLLTLFPIPPGKNLISVSGYDINPSF